MNACPPERSAICSQRRRVRRHGVAVGQRARRRCRARRCRSGCRASWPRRPPAAGRARGSPCRRRAARSRPAAFLPAVRTISSDGRERVAGRRAAARLHRRRAARRAAPSRSVVGLCTASARLLKTTPPTRTRLGTLSRNASPASQRGGQPRGRDVGRRHRAGVVHGEHDRRLLGRHRDADLRTRERRDQRRRSRARPARSGTWRRQPGRRGTTDAVTAGAANAAAARRRRRSLGDVGRRASSGSRQQAEQQPGRLEASRRRLVRPLAQLDAARVCSSPPRVTSTATLVARVAGPGSRPRRRRGRRPSCRRRTRSRRRPAGPPSRPGRRP